MSVLSDRGIKQAIQLNEISISNLQDQDIQPASIDVHLGRYLRIPDNHGIQLYDPQDPPAQSDYVLIDLTLKPYALRFGNFVLGATSEVIKLGKYHTAHIDGISSLGRMGLVIHSGSCWIDPGFDGTITLELSVGSNTPLLLRQGMRIGQLVIEEVTPSAENLYGDIKLGSKYQSQLLPGFARSFAAEGGNARSFAAEGGGTKC